MFRKPIAEFGSQRALRGTNTQSAVIDPQADTLLLEISQKVREDHRVNVSQSFSVVEASAGSWAALKRDDAITCSSNPAPSWATLGPCRMSTNGNVTSRSVSTRLRSSTAIRESNPRVVRERCGSNLEGASPSTRAVWWCK